MKKDKIALLVDSTSGLTKKEADKLGIFYVPITLTIDGKNYKDGVDITELEFLKKINTNMKLSTAAPSIGSFQKEYKKALKTYDKIFYLGYTSKMSGTWNAGIQAAKAKEFEGKITAPETQYMSTWQYHETYKLHKMIKDGASMKDLVSVIENQNKAIVGFMTTNTLLYLKNGGRVSSVTSFIGSILKILPVPCFINGNIDKNLSDKARTWTKSKHKTLVNLKPYWDKIKNKEDYEIVVLSSPIMDKEEAIQFQNDARETLGLSKNYEFKSTAIGSAITAHIGPMYTGVAIRLI